MTIPTSAECETRYRYNLLIRNDATNGTTTFNNPFPASINTNDFTGCLVYVDEIIFPNPTEDDPPLNVPLSPGYKIYIDGVPAVNSFETANVIQNPAPADGQFIAPASNRALGTTNLLGIYPFIGKSNIRPESKFNGNVIDNGVYIGTCIQYLTSFTIRITPYDDFSTFLFKGTVSISLVVQLVRNSPRIC